MIRQDDPLARRILELQLNVKISEPFSGLLLENDGEIYGAVIINNYTHWDCHLGIVSEGTWLISDARELARYCFNQLKCGRVTFEVAQSNERVHDILLKLGAKYEGCKRQGRPDDNIFLFGLLRSEQKLVRSLQ